MLHKASSQYDRQWLGNSKRIILNGAKIVGYISQQLIDIGQVLKSIEKYLINISYQKNNFCISNVPDSINVEFRQFLLY